jgi:hypothetical protein
VGSRAYSICPNLRAGDGGEARSLRRIFTELGLGEAEANDRVWLAYAFYTGHHQLGRAPQTNALQPDHRDRLVELLGSRAGK